MAAQPTTPPDVPPAPTRPVLLVGFHDDPVTTDALEARFGRAHVPVVEVPDRLDAAGPADVLHVVVEAVRDHEATAVVCAVEGSSDPVHRLGRQLASLGLADVPLVAVPTGGTDEVGAHRRAMEAVEGVVGDRGRALWSERRTRAGVVDEAELWRCAGRDAADPGTRHRPAVAVLDLAEREALRTRLGSGAVEEAVRAVARVVVEGSASTELAAVDAHGRVVVLLRDRSDVWVEHRLAGLSARVASTEVRLGDEVVSVTPVIGWARGGGGLSDEGLVGRAGVALAAAAHQLDLRPVAWDPTLAALAEESAGRRRALVATAAGQVLVTVLAGVVVPLLLFVIADRLGYPVAGPVFAVVMVVTVVTAVSVWAEGFASLRRPRLPALPDGPPPPASAIVAAYLPNESATVLETLRSVLASDHPDLEVLLAYNRPHRMPVEDALEDLAAADPRLRLVLVEGSTSKAQNVNAALGLVRGEIVGIFDADHHPARDAFTRAWRWIADGADVVQGRCVVRNGEVSVVSRLVAVEFESIYGVSHPGRSRLHGFAVFGGSNGFWRTDVLRRTRMRASMLTEDIDASVRLVGSGGRIVYDAGLESYELAPTTLSALWWQRLRWAQGWFQVTRAHGRDVGNTFSLTRRQRVGMQFLLRWREMTPWVGQLLVPLGIHALWEAGGRVGALPLGAVVVALLMLPLTSIPGQTVFGWVNASAPLRRRPGWFVLHFVLGWFVYAEWRNVVARVGHVRELTGSHDWIVTPRARRSTLHAGGAAVAERSA